MTDAKDLEGSLVTLDVPDAEAFYKFVRSVFWPTEVPMTDKKPNNSGGTKRVEWRGRQWISSLTLIKSKDRINTVMELKPEAHTNARAALELQMAVQLPSGNWKVYYTMITSPAPFGEPDPDMQSVFLDLLAALKLAA